MAAKVRKGVQDDGLTLAFIGDPFDVLEGFAEDASLLVWGFVVDFGVEENDNRVSDLVFDIYFFYVR